MCIYILHDSVLLFDIYCKKMYNKTCVCQTKRNNYWRIEMQKHKKLLALILAAMLTASAVSCSAASKKESSKDSSTSSVEGGEKDDSAEDDKAEEKNKGDIRPQDDFYGYVNYKTLTEAEIPYGSDAVTPFEPADGKDPVEELIKEIAADNTKFEAGSNEQLVHDIYHQALDYKDDGTAEKEIMGNCDRILAAENINDLFDIWGDLVLNYGSQSMFSFEVMHDYNDGTRYALYLYPVMAFLGTPIKDIAEDSAKCDSANDFARDMMRVMGDDYDTADEKGRQMVYLGLDIAKHTDVDMKFDMDMILDLKETSFDELDSIMSNYDGSFADLFLGSATKKGDGIYIADKEQLAAINDLMTEEHLEQWKTYILSSYLGSVGSYIRESNDILSDYNPESKEVKEDLAAASIAPLLPSQISEIYAQKYYTPEIDKAIHSIFDEIIGSYRELIEGADWLSADTRKALRKKLDGILLITTGEYHKTDPKDAKLVGRDYYETTKNMVRYMNNKKMELFGSPMDREKPLMTADTVNAQYLPCNSINITVAIMQPPFFDPNMSDAENLGALGSVVAHEIGHAFDSNCIKYNSDGILDPEWINEADRKVLEERADALSDYYSNYTIMEVFHVDGKSTNGENYADLSAMECITNIIDDPEDLKKLFRRYAEIWCGLEVDSSAVERLTTDEHSPGKVRVNAVLASNSKFNEVYDIKEGDGMYVAPEERVSRW